MERITRKEAIDRGLKRYTAGKPCKKCNTTERYTSHSHCCECDKLDCTLYRRKHREEIRIRNKLYRIGHTQELRLRNKTYRETHKEEIAAKQKEYRKNRRSKKSNIHLIATPLQKRPNQAKSIPAPDWNVMGLGNPNTIQRRGEMLRDIYRAKQRLFKY